MRVATCRKGAVMECEKRFTDERVSDPIDTQSCELSVKSCVMLSDDKQVIDTFNAEARSPFDEAWEETYNEACPNEIEPEPMPTGISFESFMEHINQKSQDNTVEPRISQIAAEIMGYSQLQDAIRAHFSPDGGEGTESYFSFMLAFIPAAERPEDASFLYRGTRYKFAKSYYRLEFELAREKTHGMQPFEELEGDPHAGDTYEIMTGYTNVALSDVDYRKNLRTITVTPSFTVYNLPTRGSKEVKTKNYPELAEEVVKRIIRDIRQQRMEEKINLGKSIAVDLIFLAFGVGAAITTVKNGARVIPLIADGLNVIFSTNDLIEDSTALWGYNKEKGYNVLLNSMKYLDSQTGNTKSFVTTYHAMNLFMFFGKKVKTQAITSVGSMGVGGTLYLESFQGEPKLHNVSQGK